MKGTGAARPCVATPACRAEAQRRRERRSPTRLVEGIRFLSLILHPWRPWREAKTVCFRLALHKRVPPYIFVCFVYFVVQIRFKSKVSQGQSSLVKVNAFCGTGFPRHFLPTSGHPARPDFPTIGPVKVSQTQSGLVQHKFDEQNFAGQNHPRKNSAKIPIKARKLRQLR